MKLTTNQAAAMTALIKECLSNMGGENLADLQGDPFTWVEPADLEIAGWGRKEAEGTLGSLVVAGMVLAHDDGKFHLNEDWDELAKYHA